ncbi:hypothetical protein A2368_03375 [Candidatus Collierbacteria bacterium RIFOXYB1_FULL_49_13]|uniref:Transcriptional regulatory protein n=1 Tax=Candidatus Collierbacteria bacterium RIFOXYB1_FULL_49_13 TaxID=1817728 RepID=A0A1F5FJ83_9BACT|nr:MAG: hypothetical protein A2368_03375 [Candidatus Collierbacteria bacterium RIFOXYB1_FULL_49_13]
MTLVEYNYGMSGHSKWSTIKHKKAAEDAKRGKAFTRVSRLIVMAVQKGGSGDPTLNPVLRMAIEKGREVNMPNDNVRRAIDRGLGKSGEGKMEELSYEGYAPYGVGLIIETVTDNRNRIGGEVKNILEKAGGSIGGPGSVAYLKSITPVPLISLSVEQREKVEKVIDSLLELDDVMDVWSNVEK